MKNLPRSRLLSLLIAIILGAGVVNTQTVLAAGIHEKLSVVPGRTASPVEERIMSRSAAKVLRHIANARAAIHAKDLSQARTNLKQARTLLEIIRSARPTTKVIDHIWAAKKQLNYRTTREVGLNLIPIDAELTDIADVLPVEQARKHLGKARQYLKKGKKGSAGAELDEVQNALIYTEVDLPLSSTDQAVIAAEGLLAKNKPEEADKMLAVAEDNVQFMSVATKSPLAQSRRSITQAIRDYASGRYHTARVDLAAAGSWLAQAKNSVDQGTQKKLAEMEKSVQTLSKDLSADTEHARSRLRSLWQRAVALSEYEAENISTGWQKLHGASKVKKNLIDAKLELDYAEMSQLIDHDDAALAYNLKLVKTSLNRAINAANGALKRKIVTVADEVNAIEASTGKNVKPSYEKARSDLRRLIRDI